MKRTPETFQNHLENTVANCHRSWLTLRRTTLLGDEWLVTPHLCKSNYCEVCRFRNLIAIRKMLYDSMRHDSWRLVTLTFPDHSKDILTQLRSLYSTYKKFIQRIRRKYPDVKFVRSIEIHQSGYPHIHMVVSNYIPVGFLQKHWHEVGGGFVDIRARQKVKGVKKYCSYKQAAKYLTEEFEKHAQDPHRLGVVFWQSSCRSITTSRNMQLKNKSSGWSFYGYHKTLTEAMSDAEVTIQCAKWNNAPIPTIHYGASAIKVGYGYSPP